MSSCLEHQPIVIIHALDKEMVECIIEVATQCNRTMTIECQQSLNSQRKENLRRQELKKQEGMDLAQKKLINARFWAEKIESLAWHSSREVTMKLRNINGN